MARGNDDREGALGWYCRKLVQHELDLGKTQVELARATELTKAHINQLAHGRGAGFVVCIKMAAYLRKSAGELLDEALEWWEKKGRAETAEWLHKQAAAIAEPHGAGSEHGDTPTPTSSLRRSRATG